MIFLLAVIWIVLAVVFIRAYLAVIKKVPSPTPGYPAEKTVIPVIKFMWAFTFFILFFMAALLVSVGCVQLLRG